MITIKTNPYSKKEIDKLFDLFVKMDEQLRADLCQDNIACSSCEYKNVCQAIGRTIGFLATR